MQNLRHLRPQARIGVLHLLHEPKASIPEGADVVFNSMEQALAFAPVAAIVCSPASTHLPVAQALAEAGVSLLVEKPIANTSQGLGNLFAQVRARGAQLMTAYNLRFLPSLIEARHLVLSGAIGQVLGVRAEVGQYLPDWRPGVRYQDSVSASQALGGGALLELSHEIDYVCWILGSPSRVSACGGRYGALEIDVEDMVSLTLEYDEPRLLANIHMDFLQRSASRICKFIGSEGTLVWDGIAETIDTYLSETRQWKRKELPSIPNNNAMYLNELMHFLDAIERHAPVDIDGAQGLQVLRIVEAAKLSISTRATVELA